MESSMHGRLKQHALVLQAGGVTAVINQSLAGVVTEWLRLGTTGEVYGAVHGLDGLLKQDFLDLRRQPSRLWGAVARTPGAALGSARRKLRPEEVPQSVQTLARLGVGFLFPIGGNDTAESAHLLAQAAQDAGTPLRVVAVPKTIDNDLPETDHCPGYGSAARFAALATMGAGRDAEAMGQASPVTILEVMGRNAGWLAAASALGKREPRDAPHVIAVPERPFDEAGFIARVEGAYGAHGFAVAVVSENLRAPEGPVGHQGQPLYVDDFGHPYYPSPAQHLAGVLSRRLKVRVRHERPGTIQRSLAACTSRVDAREAFLAGRMAVRSALEGRTDVMVTLLREEGRRYQCTTGLAPLEAIAGRERPLPPEYFDFEAGLPTPAFHDYARPLVGPLPRFARLKA